MDKRRILVEQLHPKSAIPEKIMMSCLPSSPKGTMDRQDQVPHNIMESNHSWNIPKTFLKSSQLKNWLNPSPRRKKDWIFQTSGEKWIPQNWEFYQPFLLLGKGWHSYTASEIFNSPHILLKDMILLQKKYSPMHNAQCGCKGYLPLSPKRFLSCWMMNGITIFEVTALILFIFLTIVKNYSFSTVFF